MNSITKVVTVSLYVLILSIFVIGCSNQANSSTGKDNSGENELEVDTLRYSGSTGQVTFWELAEDLGYLEPLKLEWTGNSTSGPENIQATVSNSIDFGGAFNGAILKLKEAGAPITAVIGYYGSDEQTYSGYYVLEDSPIKEAKDLIGKKIGVNTLGAHHEFAIVEFLRREGLTEEEIEQVNLVVIPPASGEQALRSGQLDATTLGGVIQDKALERGGIRPLFKDTDLFGSFTAGSLVFRDDFIKKNPKTVAKFVEGTAKAIEWAKVTPVEEVRERMKKIIEKRNRNEDTELIPYWKSTGIESQGGQILEKEFQVWIDWLENDGFLEKGKLSPKEVYTNEFNPYVKE
ncbi:ABC transporter substrate-binding protein [Bacillus sp. 7586-K]|nr:ABC transporter substrate-binding protein [Bacillus sp. 7586-K]